MRKQILAILIAIGMCYAFAPMVGAGPTDTIVVTLTPAGTANITVSPPTWNGAGAAIGGTGTSAVGAFNCSNVGTIPVNITIYAVDTGNWELDIATKGHNAFTLAFNITGGTWTHFDETPVTFTNALPAQPGGTYWKLFQLEVEMPTSTSTNTQQVTTITFTGTAA